ncbi:MAG: endonuclease/exonuclease/phosphatase family protein [Alphaproteobacteria bacterium]|nr:endonuclease/exonuclease/phosphatase family protein [Alphaproteobacteria bacterium]
MKISTYNVNSVNARLDNLSGYLRTENPDIMLLQEIKTEFNSFPFFELQSLGYDVKILGQKSYNGVAILSRAKIRITQENLPDFADDAARYLEGDITIGSQDWRVASVYLPNGNPPYNAPDDDSRFAYKLRWMEAFYRRAATLLELQKPVILGGDFNIIFTDNDVYAPQLFKDNALCRTPARQRLRAFLHSGWFDAFRCLHPQDAGYTFWDYSGAALQNDLGMRIDYLMCNAYAFDLIRQIDVNPAPRHADKPSDHTVLQMTLADK